MAIKGLLKVSSAFFGLIGCTAEGHLSAVLANALPQGSQITIVESCQEPLGLPPAAAVFEVAFPAQAPRPDLTTFPVKDGIWTRQSSLLEFADQHDAGPGISATVLDAKDCLETLRADARDLLFEPSSGQYFRSGDQTVVIILPDALPGTGVILTQGQ